METILLIGLSILMVTQLFYNKDWILIIPLVALVSSYWEHKRVLSEQWRTVFRITKRTT
ncbi:MAG: hypothetical protein ABIH47_05205 [Candidatus Omnitrophota bacterium]